MEQISFVFGDRATVPGWLGTNVKEEVVGHILSMQPDKILLVTDSMVDNLHGEYFSGAARDVAAAPGEAPTEGIIEKFVLPQGDTCKSWEHLSALMEWAFKINTTKKSVIVAFGGGALLNITGLFASILFRGTKLVYVPTTFLAMHDVVTSLKTSICYDGRKNNIGSFYAPMKILIDVNFCSTLPRSELFSGIGELMKNACLFGGKHAQGMRDALSKERIDGENGGSGEEISIDMDTLQKLLRLGIEAKMTALMDDAYEKTSAMIFEYGHTISHAIEKAYGDGTVPHGIGVTYGMMSSSYAAHEMGLMSTKDREEHDNLCEMLLCKWPLPEPKPTIEKVLSLAMRDSKRGITGESNDELSDVLLFKLGDVVPTKTSNLSKFSNKYTQEWLAAMGFPSEFDTRPDAVTRIKAGKTKFCAYGCKSRNVLDDGSSCESCRE